MTSGLDSEVNSIVRETRELKPLDTLLCSPGNSLTFVDVFYQNQWRVGLIYSKDVEGISINLDGYEQDKYLKANYSSEKIARFRTHSKPFTGSSPAFLREISSVDFRLHIDFAEKYLRELDFERLPPPSELLKNLRGEVPIKFDAVCNSVEEMPYSIESRFHSLSAFFFEFFLKFIDFVNVNGMLYTLCVSKAPSSFYASSKVCLFSAIAELRFIFQMLIFESQRPLTIKRSRIGPDLLQKNLLQIERLKLVNGMFDLLSHIFIMADPGSKDSVFFSLPPSFLLQIARIIFRVAKATKSRQLALKLDEAIRKYSEDISEKDIEHNSPADVFKFINFRYKINSFFKLRDELPNENHGINLRKIEISLQYLKCSLLTKRISMCKLMDSEFGTNQSPSIKAFCAETFLDKGVFDALARTHYNEECIKACGNFFTFISPYIKPNELFLLSSIHNESDAVKALSLEFIAKRIGKSLPEGTFACVIQEVKSGRFEPFLLSIISNAFIKEDSGIKGYITSFGWQSRVLEKSRTDLSNALSSKLASSEASSGPLIDCITVIGSLLKEAESVKFISPLLNQLAKEKEHCLKILRCLTVLLETISSQKKFKFSFGSRPKVDINLSICEMATRVIQNIAALPSDEQQLVTTLLFPVMNSIIDKFYLTVNEEKGFKDLFVASFSNDSSFVRSAFAKFAETSGDKMYADYFPFLVEDVINKIPKTTQFIELIHRIFLEKNASLGRIRLMGYYFIVEDKPDALVGIGLLWKFQSNSLIDKIYRYHSDQLEDDSVIRLYYSFWSRLRQMLNEAVRAEDQAKIKSLLELGLTFNEGTAQANLRKTPEFPKYFIQVKMEFSLVELEMSGSRNLYEVLREAKSKFGYYGLAFLSTEKEDYRTVGAMEGKLVSDLPLNKLGFRELSMTAVRGTSPSVIRMRVKEMLGASADFSNLFDTLLSLPSPSYEAELKLLLSEFPTGSATLTGIKSSLETKQGPLENIFPFLLPLKFWFYSQKLVESLKKEKPDAKFQLSKVIAQNHLQSIPQLLVKIIEREGVDSETMAFWIDISLIAIPQGNVGPEWLAFVEKSVRDILEIAAAKEPSAFSESLSKCISLWLLIGKQKAISVQGLQLFYFAQLNVTFEKYRSLAEVALQFTRLFPQKKEKQEDLPEPEVKDSTMPQKTLSLKDCSSVVQKMGNDWLQTLISTPDFAFSSAQKMATIEVFQYSTEYIKDPDCQAKLAQSVFSDPALGGNPVLLKRQIAFLTDAVMRKNKLISQSEWLTEWIDKNFIQSPLVFDNPESPDLTERLFLLIKLQLSESPRLVEGIRKWIWEARAGGTRSIDWKKETQTPPAKKIKGLVNLGATCYINSFLQQLWNIEILRSEILSKEIDSPLLIALQQLFIKMEWAKLPAVDAEPFVKQLKTAEGNPVNPKEQFDVDEFAARLLDQLDQLFRIDGKQSRFEQQFQGEFSNQIVGKNCGHTVETKEPFTILPLSVREVNSVPASIAASSEWEMLEGDNGYRCSQCSQKVDAKRRQVVSKVAPLLFLSLKRFEFDIHAHKRVKLNKYFEIPQSIEIAGCKMLLRGFIVHIGTGEFGHYISYAKVGNEWYEFNDSEVKQFNISKLKEVAYGGENNKTSAYIVVYQKENSDLHAEIPKPEKLVSNVMKENQSQLLWSVVVSDSFINLLTDLKETTVATRLMLLEYFFFVLTRMTPNRSKLFIFYPIVLSAVDSLEVSVEFLENFCSKWEVFAEHSSCPFSDTLLMLNHLLKLAIRKASEHNHPVLYKVSNSLICSLALVGTPQPICSLLQVVASNERFAKHLLHMRIDVILMTGVLGKPIRKYCQKLCSKTFEEKQKKLGSEGPLASLVLTLSLRCKSFRQKLFTQNDLMSACESPQFAGTYAQFVVDCFRNFKDVASQYLSFLMIDRHNVRVVLTTLLSLKVEELVTGKEIVNVIWRFIRADLDDYFIFDVLICFVAEVVVQDPSFVNQLGSQLLEKLESINNSLLSIREINATGYNFGTNSFVPNAKVFADEDASKLISGRQLGTKVGLAKEHHQRNQARPNQRTAENISARNVQ